MSMQTFLFAIHLLGFSFGVGASTILDLRIVGLLSGRVVSEQDQSFATLLSIFVRVGLMLLWMSGACFLIRYWMTAPELLVNPKLHAKLAIVVALTLNGVVIELFVMPLLKRRRGRALFDGLSFSAQCAAVMTGAVSATSWYAAFALGVAREWNFVVSTTTVLGFYALAVVAAGCVAIVAMRIVYRPASDTGPTARLQAQASGSPAVSPTAPQSCTQE
jgi:hypothetical protein